jgi:hypothetical protein
MAKPADNYDKGVCSQNPYGAASSYEFPNIKELCMKHFVFILIAIAFAFSAEAADVGVSVSVGQPGFYGQIDIGNFPRPQVIYPQPVVVSPMPVVHAPIYLHVPPGHQKHWSKHCHKYSACGRPVYFVRNQWYNDVYVPRYQERHGHGNNWHDGHGHGNYGKKGHGKGHGKD